MAEKRGAATAMGTAAAPVTARAQGGSSVCALLPIAPEQRVHGANSRRAAARDHIGRRAGHSLAMDTVPGSIHGRVCAGMTTMSNTLFALWYNEHLSHGLGGTVGRGVQPPTFPMKKYVFFRTAHVGCGYPMAASGRRFRVV